jgi:hypothetical protein
MTGLRSRWDGCGVQAKYVPALTSRKGKSTPRGVGLLGGVERRMGVEGYGAQSTVRQVRRYLTADLYRYSTYLPDMSLYPGSKHGGAARRTVQVRVGTKGALLHATSTPQRCHCRNRY